MFTELPPQNRRRRDFSLLVSFMLHVAFLLMLAHRAAPVFVMPSDVALGTPGSSGSVVYLAPLGPEKASTPQPKQKLALNKPKLQLRSLPVPPPFKQQNENPAPSAGSEETAMAGSPYGARIPGAPLTGHEIIPALPQVFPDPAITRADLPAGVEGDVVVEVTIDERGNVVELKLIRGIGYGVEERVLATLRKWRFKPASKDGVTIASQHIVTFHYPS
ncbi:MAG TPA: TonB family protein [Candidatus Binatia bacterium]|nr:TonB family protein [Candidatus Binatia bacterium]